MLLSGNRGKLTVQIVALLLSENCTHFLNPGGQRNLDVLGHDLVPLLQVACLSCVPDHGLDSFYGLLTTLKPSSDLLCQSLNLALLLQFDRLIVEPGEDVF